MPFDWRELMPLAEELAQRIEDEGAGRSAIGRAYYAAMGHSAEILRSEGRRISFLKVHADTVRALRASSDARRVTAGAALNELRQMRNRADYDAATNEDWPKLARDAIDRAATVLDAFEDRAPPR